MIAHEAAVVDDVYDDARIPLDNNASERQQRGPAVGRKNYYGSGALWSGRLAAMLGEAISMLVPQVVGFRLTGALPDPATGTAGSPAPFSPSRRRRDCRCGSVRAPGRAAAVPPVAG